MTTSKKIYFVSILIGCLLTSANFTQSQNTKAPFTGSVYSTEYYVYAGIDATICNDGYYIVKGISTFNEPIFWYSSGDGVFQNPYSLKTTYLPGPNDIANGYVVLSLGLLLKESSLAKEKDAPMSSNMNKFSISDEMVLYLGNCIGIDER